MTSLSWPVLKFSLPTIKKVQIDLVRAAITAQRCSLVLGKAEAEEGHDDTIIMKQAKSRRKELVTWGARARVEKFSQNDRLVLDVIIRGR